MPKRKTYTSWEVKNRWNRKHYENVNVLVTIGAKDEIKAIAESRGMSVSAYIRHLIIKDNPLEPEKPDILPILRGGGVMNPDQIRELYFMYGVPTDDISDSQLLRALGRSP